MIKVEKKGSSSGGGTPSGREVSGIMEEQEISGEGRQESG